ncbi:Alginate export domain-containing protein [Candidatus Magnetomoraceae bacterium gMMP-13]
MQCDKKINRFWKVLSLFLLLIFVFLKAHIQAAENNESFFWDQFDELEFHGFYEVRAGSRTQNDPHEKDISVMETRLQAELFTYNNWIDFKYKGDIWADGVTEQGEYDTREAWIFSRPADFLDVKIGRQILTWGTGNLVFLNDLFPKDWQSFFIGRDEEYLKAPSDAVKFSFFTDFINFNLVYTPQFDSDRFITGEYISHWNGSQKSLTGRNAILQSDKPDSWFKNDEIAVRAYKNIKNYEVAFYGYRGFWKRPAGKTYAGVSTFPKLNVFGASARGQIGSGIGNIELAYYQSADDESGTNPQVDNSEMRYLLGYTQDIGKNFNLSIQYYVEQMLNYSNYEKNITDDFIYDQYRHVITLQLTKLLLNQNLELSLSAYCSPSDEDFYLRPKIRYKYTDRIILETGANIFGGSDSHTFFNQFKNNTNSYLAIRYNF